MNKIACIYFEGNDSKVALFEWDKEKLKLLKAESVDMSVALVEQKTLVSKGNGVDYDFLSVENGGSNKSYLQRLNEFFAGVDLSKVQFIPILSEPAIYFQKVNDEKDLAALNISSKGKIEQTIGFVELYDNSKLAVYSSGKSNYLQALDSLAKIKSRRFLKIPSVKSAEISLASYVSRKYKFENSQNTLILYVGKEYSKLIFLKGNKLSHIGSKIAVGKNSFNAHNVIISKILLEMEQDYLNHLDNIIICGEDDSKELLSKIREAYPGSKVKQVATESLEIQIKEPFTSIASFSVPIAAAEDFIVESGNKSSTNNPFGKSVNLLPNYIKEEQKSFNIGWQGYTIILLIFLSAFLITSKVLINIQNADKLDNEIDKLTLIQQQNKKTVEKIKNYENKIQNVDQTKAVLNQLSGGTGVVSSNLKKISDFTNFRRNFWIAQLLINKNENLKISGYTYSRTAVKALSDSYQGALLQNIVYEPIRDTRTFKFLISTGN